MGHDSLDYRSRSAEILRDEPGVRESVTGATLHFDRNRDRSWREIDASEWRTWAAAVKSHALTHLDRHLAQAAASLESNGVQVHWAASAAEANDAVASIARANGVRSVVKGKSMLSEELHINERLAADGIEVFETDLGEYIIQLLGEPPSHILGPAIHRSLADIRVLFNSRFGTPLDASPEALAARARERLREAFLSADMGITGCNFIAADTGTIALIENEGNIRLSTSLPRVHVALVGIEKVVARWSDLAHLLQLTARAATGQRIGTFVSLIQGPRELANGSDASRRAGGRESDGPDAVHVIFVDNGRSRVLADPVAWEALRCVRCGACLNTCPVYRQTGGHAYGWVYSGPIGAVLAPGLLGLEKASALPFASSLCGACADVCPVRIDIPALLLEWRRRAVRQGFSPSDESKAMSTFAALATRPSAFRAAGAAFRRMPSSVRNALPVIRDWTASHDAIQPERRGFARLWKRERKRKVDPIPADRSSPENGPREQHDTANGSVFSDADASQRKDAQADVAAGARRAFASGSLRPASRPADSRWNDNAVLAAVGEALGGRTRIAHPGALSAQPEHGTADDGDAIGQFVERFSQNGGEVVRFGSGAEASAWISELSHRFGSCDVGLFVPEHLSPLMTVMKPAAAEDAALGVSSAMACAADTGTILLDSRDGRATQLLPPAHLIWIRESTIHHTLASALADAGQRLPAAIGLHSGPSRSADIGRVLVTGVHGPGHVIAAIIP